MGYMKPIWGDGKLSPAQNGDQFPSAYRQPFEESDDADFPGINATPWPTGKTSGYSSDVSPEDPSKGPQGFNAWYKPAKGSGGDGTPTGGVQ